MRINFIDHACAWTATKSLRWTNGGLNKWWMHFSVHSSNCDGMCISETDAYLDVSNSQNSMIYTSEMKTKTGKAVKNNGW